MIRNEFGQPCYILENGRLRVSITVQGGHLRASFPHRGREVSPFFVAPWWNEAPLASVEQVIRVLRGDFFCLPFGGNPEPHGGVKYPVHGATANDCWELEREGEQELALGLPAYGGRIRKRVALESEAAVLYSEHQIHGLRGRMPAGHHAILQFPDKPGCGLVDFSEPVAGFSSPVAPEEPGARGYSLLAPGEEIRDRTRAPTVHGDTLDLTRYPLAPGYEDVAQFVSDAAREFCFSSVSFPEEGYLFFQLKDPRTLSSTLLWRSNGGRHYPPWNGRVRGVLGLEEVTSYFAFGIQRSAEPNPLSEKGFRTCLQLDAGRPASVRLIMGLVPVPAGFAGVRDILRERSGVLIHGRGGEKLRVPCRVDFLAQG